MTSYAPYKIATIILIATILVTGVAAYVGEAFFLFKAVAVGHLLAYAHIMSGFYILSRYFNAKNKLFFRAVFGGMAVRMAVILLLMVMVLGWTEIHKFSFTVSLVISYILYSIIEMIYIYKNLEANTDNS